MSRSFLASAVGLLATAALFQNVAAQVTTDCQPLNKTCPADPAFGMDFNFNFNSTPNAQTWETTVGPVKYDATNGATFTLTNQGDSPTIRSKFYFFFGRVEINMKASPGTGIISSIMLLSDDLDEIDWEFMGGNSTHAETNYFGKGHQDFHNAIYYPVSGGVQDDYHNYTLVWTQDALDYYIDTQKVRTLLPADANNTLYYPQTPMRLSIGIWAGGDPTLPQGTRDWAGGTTDYTQGPFNMYVKNAHVTDYSSGSEYTYGDQTGSWESIKITTGNSTAKEAITATPAPTLAEKWNALPSGAKTAVYAGAGGVGALIILAALFYCIKQRRRGAREAKFAELKAEEEKRELDAFRKAGIDPDSFREEATEYNAKDMAREGVTQGNSYSIPNSPVVGQPTSAAAIGAGASVAAAAAGARSPMPLLRDGQSSPRMGSPGPNNNTPYTDRAMYNNSPVSMRSPPPSAGAMRTPSPGMGQQQQRSYTGPNPNMRVASPGPARGGYGDVQRMASPGPVGAPQPQRSFTTGGYGDMQRMASPGPAPQPQRSFTGGGYGPQPGASPYGQNGGNDQGYWGGNNYR